MSWNIFSKFDHSIPVIAAIVILAFLLTGCLRVTDVNGNPVDLKKDSTGVYYLDTVKDVEAQYVFKALVKGSIYETGEYMSVFGTCLYGDDTPALTSYGNLSAWYPNGTQFIFNDTMTLIQPGYFVWRGNMSSVEGTYLTEMTCYLPGSNITAKAFGEWQNPAWVRKIGAINDTVTNLNLTLGNLEIELNNSFQITWDMINYTNYLVNYTLQTLNQSIYNVGLIANASVDRNDSYLAQLLQNLTGYVLNISFTTNVSGNPLNYTEEADYPVYWKTWNIKVIAHEPGNENKKVAWPDSLCYINTTLTPVYTFMDPQGSYFEYSEKITTSGDYNWSVYCVYS